MEDFLKSIGLYNIVGVFISGALFVYMIDFLNIYNFFYYFNDDSNNTFVKGFALILLCYLIGLFLQEVSSLLDRKKLRFRDKAKSNFLNNKNNVFKNEIELKVIQKIANKILNKKTTNTHYTKSECEYFYFYCKAVLENKNKNEKENMLNSLYAMSRSLFVGFILLVVGFVAYLIKNKLCFDLVYIFQLFILLSAIVLTYIRCDRLPKIRVRTIIRQYNAMCTIIPKS